MHASKSRTEAAAGFDAPSALHAGAIPSPSQFAPSQDYEPDGTIAKRPAVGPTSRLLRAFLHHRLDDWRHRMVDESRDPQAFCDRPDGTGEALGPVLDKSGLEELCANLSSAEAREFVWLCIVDSEMRLTDIASHRAAGDLKKVAEVAQRIAREAARLGALRVHVLALRLETACRAGSDGTYGLISDLSDAWGEVGEALCAWLTGQASPVAA